MNIDFTNIITWAVYAVSVLTVTFTAAKIIPFLKEKGFYEFTAQMVRAAVTYFLDGQGREKFDWVFEQVNSRYGKWFDVEAVKNAIQAAYVDMCISLGKEPSPARVDENAP